MDIERKAYYEKELDFRISRSYGPGRYDAAYEQKGRDYPIGYVRWTETRNMEAFVQFLAEEKSTSAGSITHRFPIDRAQSAYDLITGKSREPFLGVVIQYPGSGDDARTLALVPEHTTAPPRPVSAAGVSVGLLGAGVFAAGTLLPALKASSDTALVAVCAATGSHAQHAATQIRIPLLHHRRSSASFKTRTLTLWSSLLAIICTRTRFWPRSRQVSMFSARSRFA